MNVPYGDRDPEDAYDATDPVTVRLDVLERVAANLCDTTDVRFDDRRTDALRLVTNLDREPLARRDRRRLDKIRDLLEELG